MVIGEIYMSAGILEPIIGFMILFTVGATFIASNIALLSIAGWAMVLFGLILFVVIIFLVITGNK